MNPDPHSSFDNRDTHGTLPQRLGRSGYVTPSLVGILCLALLLATYEQGRGKYVRLRDSVLPQSMTPGPSTGPGGPAPIVLTHHSTERGSSPEFLSATFLPGRGFNLWQISAYLPGHGEVPLLVSPSIDDATHVLSGTGADANGSASTSFGAAFLAPWAGSLSGTPSSGGGLQSMWNSTPLFFPAQTGGATVSTQGLLLKQIADNISTPGQPDSSSTQAVFHAQSFGNQWPGSTDITIAAELSGSTLDLTMTAHNIGSVPEPIGLGWLPHFALPSGHRADALLTIPASQHATSTRGGLPSGRVESVSDTPRDLQHAGGTRLGNLDLDETYLDLHAAMLADGPIAELRDPSFGYGLRVLSLTPSITNLRVIAPADKPWVSIGPNTNVPDPFGQEWKDLDSTGMVTVQPGATVQWKVRLELFAPGATTSDLPTP